MLVMVATLTICLLVTWTWIGMMGGATSPRKARRRAGNRSLGNLGASVVTEAGDASGAAQKGSRVELRGAFDVGSASTKLTLAWVDVTRGAVVEVLYSNQVDVLVGVDLRRGEEGRLSEEILHELSAVCGELMLEAEEEIASSYVVSCRNASFMSRCTPRYRGIATAAFRLAENGHEILAKLSAWLQVPLEVISQEEEGRLGYLTAVAISGSLAVHRPPGHPMMAWDSGGASFQLTIPREFEDGILYPAQVEAEDFYVFEGGLGSSSVSQLLVESVQGKSFEETISGNPVSIHECYELLELVTSQVTVGKEYAWLQRAMSMVADGRASVIGFGGDSSMFQTAVFAVYNMAHFLDGMGARHSSAELLKTGAADVVTRAQLWTATSRLLVNKSDGELRRMGFDPPEFIIAKLVLMCAVMDALGLEAVHVFPANGSTAGLLVSATYW